MRRIILTATLALASVLGGCATAPPHVTDDMGRIRMSTDPSFLDKIAAYSNNPAVQDRAAELVRKNFSVRLVSVPYSHLLIRLVSCSDKTTVRLCVNAQYNGKILGSRSYKVKINGATPGALRILEDILFRDPDTEDDFIDFVEEAIDQATRLDRGC